MRRHLEIAIPALLLLAALTSACNHRGAVTGGPARESPAIGATNAVPEGATQVGAVYGGHLEHLAHLAKVESTASGNFGFANAFFVDRRGTFLTNFHVVRHFCPDEAKRAATMTIDELRETPVFCDGMLLVVGWSSIKGGLPADAAGFTISDPDRGIWAFDRTRIRFAREFVDRGEGPRLVDLAVGTVVRTVAPGGLDRALETIDPPAIEWAPDKSRLEAEPLQVEGFPLGAPWGGWVRSVAIADSKSVVVEGEDERLLWSQKMLYWAPADKSSEPGSAGRAGKTLSQHSISGSPLYLGEHLIGINSRVIECADEECNGFQFAHVEEIGQQGEEYPLRRTGTLLLSTIQESVPLRQLLDELANAPGSDP